MTTLPNDSGSTRGATATEKRLHKRGWSGNVFHETANSDTVGKIKKITKCSKILIFIFPMFPINMNINKSLVS